MWLHIFVQQKREDKAIQTSRTKSWTSKRVFVSVVLWRYIWWHQIIHRVLCVSNVWKKEDKLSRSSTTRVKHVKHVYFVTKYKPKKGSASLNQNQAKKLDSSIIPPCSKVLHQKIKRCIYVASIRVNLLRTEPTPHLPTSFGWTLYED